jgi:hypothetical protein
MIEIVRGFVDQLPSFAAPPAPSAASTLTTPASTDDVVHVALRVGEIAVDVIAPARHGERRDRDRLLLRARLRESVLDVASSDVALRVRVGMRHLFAVGETTCVTSGAACDRSRRQITTHQARSQMRAGWRRRHHHQAHPG